MSDCKHDWHFVQGLTERLRCLRCGVMTWPKSVEERTQEMLADVLTIGSAWSKDGERIDPASVFKDHGAIHSCSYHCDRPECIKAQRDELRERLAQLEQEPVEWQHRKPIMDSQGNTRGYYDWSPGKGLERWPHRRLYTSPPEQRKPEQEPIKESSITHGHLWIGDLYGKEKSP